MMVQVKRHLAAWNGACTAHRESKCAHHTRYTVASTSSYSPSCSHPFDASCPPANPTPSAFLLPLLVTVAKYWLPRMIVYARCANMSCDQRQARSGVHVVVGCLPPHCLHMSRVCLRTRARRIQTYTSAPTRDDKETVLFLIQH